MSQRPKDYALVTTVTSVKSIYMIPVDYIRAEAEDQNVDDEFIKTWIKDSVTCEEVKESGQRFIGENIIDCHVISKTRALQIFEEHNGDALAGWDEEKKIEYLNDWKDKYTWKQKDKKDITL